MATLTNESICVKLDALLDKMDTGFSGIHDRQDKTNGNVAENTKYRLKTIGSMNTLKVLVAFFGVGTILNIIALIVK